MVDFSGNSSNLNKYGSSFSGSSYGAKKQQMNTGAGASSEKLMLQRMQEQKKQAERQKAKQDLADIQRKIDHNKLDISHRETESRRLASEIAHEERELQDLNHDMKALEEKEHSMKTKKTDSETASDKLDREISENKKIADEISRKIQQLDREIMDLQQELVKQKHLAYEVGVKIQKAMLEERQTDTQASKASSDADHAKSDHRRKEMEIDAKKQSVDHLKQRREYEIHEMDRLKAENVKYEIEAKNLESKAR